MGLFDSLVNAAGDMMGQGGDTLSAVSNLIQENGGVGGLVEKFQQGGLGDIVSSWVGTGANLPVSAEQIQSVLDGSQLGGYLPPEQMLKVLDGTAAAPAGSR